MKEDNRLWSLDFISYYLFEYKTSLGVGIPLIVIAIGGLLVLIIYLIPKEIGLWVYTVYPIIFLGTGIFLIVRGIRHKRKLDDLRKII